MQFTVAVVMDPIEGVVTAKDSTFAMLLAGQRLGLSMHYVQPGSLALDGGQAMARTAPVTVVDQARDFFRLDAFQRRPLGGFDVVLMRKDPPVDVNFMHDTRVLAVAQRQGALVVNDPTGLLELNEKLAALLFPQCCPPTRVSRSAAELRDFIAEHGDCVLKPLDGMGGRSIFRVRQGEDNLNVILETLTRDGRELAMAQRYLPGIREGDKRILLIEGEPVPYALARIPQGGEFRGNLAVGGRGEGRPLDERDRWIAAEVGPELRRRGMVFVGLDVIGEHLTEVNVTSPTCIRELDREFGLDIAGRMFEAIAARLDARA
ncbi:MAG: glutathione synthase [Lysobacteraceae bacterium]